MKYRFIFVCLGLAHAAGAQQLVGKVVDATTGQPVPYASVAVLRTSLGTTSNAEGEFELRAGALPVRLVVSELGHRRDTVAVATAQQALQIRLVPAPVLLPEVNLGSYTEELIKKAYHQLQRTNSQSTYGQAFYRQITRQDGDATEVQEMVWDAKTNNAGVEGTALSQARYAEKKALVKFKDFSIYTKSFAIFSPKTDSSRSVMVMSPNVGNYYTLHLLGVTQDGPQQLIEIGFSSKPGVNPHDYKGSLVINEATKQVLRLRLETQELAVKSNNPAAKFKDQRTALEWVFRATPTGAATLSYVRVGYQAAISRPFKADVQIQASSFTAFYNGSATPTGIAYAGAGGAKSDLAAIKQTTYDAAFWQNNSVVKRTPLEEEVIKSFEATKSFGTLLTP